MNYFSLHIGDYAAATAHLSLVEDAIYCRLLRRYYLQESPLPADLKAVARLAGARTEDEVAAVAVVLDEFFVLTAEGWHNKRADEEIAAYQAKQGKARASASARWSKREECDSDANAMRTQCDGNANQEPITNNQEKQEQKTSRPASPRASTSKPDIDLSGWPEQPSPQVLADWLLMRKRKKADVTQTVVNRMATELRAAAGIGFGVDDCLSNACLRNWTGFKAEWMGDLPRAGPGLPQHGKTMSAITAIEDRKNALRQRMAGTGAGDGNPEAALPQLGKSAGA